MNFKFKNFTLEINKFDYWAIYNSLHDYMLESQQDEYKSYMNAYKEYYECVAEEQRAEYGTRYDVEFALECASADYMRHIEQECDFIVSKWQDQFNGICRQRIARKRRKPCEKK